MSMDKIDPNHDLVPTLRMMDGLLFDRAADEIEKWRDAYRKAVQTPAAELMVVGPGWHERFPVITAPIVIDGLLQVHVSDRRDDMADELARLRAEVEALRADAERLTGERDVAIGMLAYWCVAVDQNGTGWDDWDEHYKDAMYRPCPIRELLDKEINAVRAAQGWRG
jgi:hypothetical protein